MPSNALQEQGSLPYLPRLWVGTDCRERSKVQPTCTGEDMLLGGVGPHLPCFQPHAPILQAVPAKCFPVANSALGPERVSG